MGGMQLEAEVRAHDVVAQKACSTRLVKGRFKAFVGLENFAVDVVVAHADAHGIGCNGHAFDHDVRVVLQDFTVFASTRLTLVGVAHQILLAGKLAGHEAPLQAGGKARTAATAQARLFDGGNDLVLGQALAAVLAQNFAQGLVATARHIVLQRPVAAVEVGQDLRAEVTAMKAGLDRVGLKL